MGSESIRDYLEGRITRIWIVSYRTSSVCIFCWMDVTTKELEIQITVIVLGHYNSVATSNYTLTDCMADIGNRTESSFTNPFKVSSTNFAICQATCLQENNCIAFYHDTGTCHHYSNLYRLIEYQTGNLYFKCLACEHGWYYYDGLCYGFYPNCSNVGAVSARFYGLDAVLIHMMQKANKPVYVREIINRNGVWIYDTYNVTFNFVADSGEICVYANLTLPLFNVNCSLGFDEICEKDGKPKYQATKSDTTAETISTNEADPTTAAQTVTDFTSTVTVKTTSLTTPAPTEKLEITTENFPDQIKTGILAEIQRIDSQTDQTTVRKLLKDLGPYMTKLTSNETQVVINATYNLVNCAIKANYSETEYPLLLRDVANMTSNAPKTNEDLKLALTNSMLKITNKILFLGKKEQSFYFPCTDYVVAGVKTDQQNLDGLNLKTEYGEVNIPDSMQETETTMYFKMISYKDPILEPNTENKTQSSTVYICMEDDKSNAIPNPDPDRTFELVLKCETLKKRAWHDITKEKSAKVAYQIPLTKSGLCLVELSSPDIAVWGKMNRTPTKYNYHFYYSALGQDKDFVNIVRIPSVKIEKYARFLRIRIHCNDPQTILYLLVDSGGRPFTFFLNTADAAFCDHFDSIKITGR